FIGASVLTDLVEAAQEAGYKIMTADIYLSKPDIPGKKYLFTEIFSCHTDQLIKMGVIPAVCTCAESPLIAYDFYHYVNKYAGRFENALLFGGTRDRLNNSNTTFFELFWPNTNRIPRNGISWLKRKFIVMINSNKQTFNIPIMSLVARNPYRMFRNLLVFLNIQTIKLFDSWMKFDLYKERQRAIIYLSKNPQFELFGQGWNKTIHKKNKTRNQNIANSYRGTIEPGTEHKLDVLEKYKYVICFENCIFPGYITEKIFDCFFAGCIPVYYGAPDIEKFIPKETFIDFRDFMNYADLEKFLFELSDELAEKYRNAAKDFLDSHRFDRFTSSNYVESILSAINNSVKRHE
ncbi:MAG: hypothetical protein C0412_11635, partial [Flavobacterium sp.]|nr:hypothetical protein [Flavobacterium sp.]